MATASRTYGNTLSDLQAGTNADKAITYSRQNAEDTTSQQRLEAFLRLRGQELQTKAQQNEKAADRAHDLKLGEMGAKSRLDVANATAGKSAAFAELQALNAEQDRAINKGRQMSAARIAALAEKKKIKDAQNRWALDFGDPNVSWYNRSIEPRWIELTDVISKLDAEAAQLGFAPGPDGGYVLGDGSTGRSLTPNPVVPANPASVPAMLNQPLPVTTPQGSAWMGMGNGLPNTANRVVAPPAMIPLQPVEAAPTNRFELRPNGQWVPY